MKKYVLFLFCCLSVFGQAAAQESRSLSLSATIEFGNLEYSSSSLMGAGSFDSSSFTGIGIHVTQPIYEHWDIVTGISYGWASGDFSNPSNRGPGISDPIRQTYKFFTLPVLARFHFWKYFFIDGGVYCDAKVSEKNELLFGF
ncbi:MAG: PorT family protein, partial [Prevotellaceae bacterium]|nr:PorT family protein [Prevotellaceae bacterium]